MSKVQDFNIITGQILQYQTQRQHRSLMNLDKQNKTTISSSAIPQQKTKLPPLGVPKDQKSFQYSYMNPQEQKSTYKLPKNKRNVMLNYTYEKTDPITHRTVNPNCSQLNHKDFQKPLELANMKGVLTKHIDQGRIYAPNFHQNFPQRVQKHEFHRRNRVCGGIAEIQKSYSIGKYFRKMK